MGVNNMGSKAGIAWQGPTMPGHTVLPLSSKDEPTLPPWVAVLLPVGAGQL